MLLKIPGFIDLQVNGYGGVDFSSHELTEDSFVETVRKLANNGTYIFLPTLISSPPELYERNLKLISKAIEKYRDIAIHVPGIHLEGPFISRAEGARGIHPPGMIKNPSISLFRKMLKWANGKIKMLTLACELTGSQNLIRFATEKGVIVSLGHQLAGEKDIELAVKSGAKTLTHLGNGIPHTINRHDNPIFAALANDRLQAMIITDGHHLPESLIKIIIRTKSTEKILITSDSSPLAGLCPGRYRYKDNEVVLTKDHRIYSVIDGYLAGSGSSMFDCMNHLASLKILNVEELLTVGFYNQLRLLMIDKNIQPQRRVKRMIFDRNKSIFYLCE